ncbi:MAG: alanine racemase [Acidobacteriaceae bacterium]
MPPYPITRAEISRSRLVGNFQQQRSLVQTNANDERCDLLAVVKADAYGHGIAHSAPWLAEAGAEWLGVTSAEEGVAVRKLCPQARILVMRGLLAGEAEMLLNSDLAPTIWDYAHLQLLEEAARQRQLAPDSIPVHLEIDTGMSRQGLHHAALDVAAFLDRLRSVPALRLDGVYTHFASPEMLDAEQNSQQRTRFQQAVEQIAAAGFRPRWLHAGNSSSVLGQQIAGPLAALAARIGARCMVRPGIALYGYASRFTGEQSTKAEATRAALEPVLAWKTAIASLRTVGPGASVGYDATFVATKKMRLALLPVGYADGLNRKLSNCGHVLVRGVAAPIVGRISMDLTVVDVSHLPDAAIGDEVVLLGEQNGLRVTADDHARWAETIPYEILCAISARVPRVPCK